MTSHAGGEIPAAATESAPVSGVADGSMALDMQAAPASAQTLPRPRPTAGVQANRSDVPSMMPQPSPPVSLTEARALAEYGPWLYRLHDEAGRLLYIGVTVRLPSERFNAHSRSKNWWPEVATVQLARYPSEWECLNAERAAIKRESPIHNRRSAVKADAP